MFYAMMSINNNYHRENLANVTDTRLATPSGTSSQQNWYWKTTAACFLLQAFSSGLIGIFGLYVNPVAEEFGISASKMALGIALLIVAGGLLGPIIGSLLDRVAPKPIMLFGIALATVSLTLSSQADSITGLLGFYILFAVGLAHYGPLATNVVLSKHYQPDPARPLALSALGVSTASAALPIIMALLMAQYGWRDSLTILALTAGAIAAGAALFGLPGGKPDSSTSAELPIEDIDNSAGDDADDSDKSFFRDKNFWFIGLSFSMLFGIATVAVLSIVPHMENIGISTAVAAGAISVMGASGFVGKLSFAMLAGFCKRHINVFCLGLLVMHALCYLLLAYSENINVIYLAMFLGGFSGGIFIPLYPYMNSLYFDNKILGRVNGGQGPILLVGLCFAPLAGLVFDRSGSYSGAFLGVIGLIAVVGVLVSSMSKIRR